MIFEHIINLMAPDDCLNCGSEGQILCSACLAAIQPVPPRCWRCRRVSVASETCAPCRSHSRLRHAGAAAEYEGVARELVRALKFSGKRTAAEVMTNLMLPLLPAALPGAPCYIVHVPTATTRRRQRGYDQAELLARALSAQSSLRHLPLLARLGHTRQVGTKRAERLAQLEHAFRARRESLIQGAHIILIDDVLTTGATLEAAARTLKAAGARRVDALVFAQA